VRAGYRLLLGKQYQSHLAAETYLRNGNLLRLLSASRPYWRNVIGGNFLTTVMDRWLTNFGEKTDHLAIGYYRPDLDLR
jgi:hypothetical protein